jgi:gluconolactonase
MSYFQAFDERFMKYLIPVCKLETLHTGMRWAEGPVYFADGRYLVFSDIPNNRMLRWEEESGQVSVFRDGAITVLAERFEGKRLNSPNDVVVKSDGSVWFTDPPYGILTDYEGHKAESEIGSCNVYRLDAAGGEPQIVRHDFDKPNGLAFSPDEKLLYIADSGRSHGVDKPHHIRVFDVSADGKLSGGRVFADIDPGVPDGFRVDTDGNLWIAAGDGVHCYSAQGQLLGKILTPETVANVTFGGAQRNRLFIAATSSLHALYLNTRGAQTP